MYSHLSEKGPNSRNFFTSDKLQNHTNSNEGKEMAKKERVRRKKGGKEKTAKADCYIFITPILQILELLSGKKINICWNEEVYLKRK